MNPPPDPRAQPQPADWPQAQPERLPQPTYWPFFLAVGLAFMFWGLLTSWIMEGAGLLLFTIALTGWIRLLRHE